MWCWGCSYQLRGCWLKREKINSDARFWKSIDIAFARLLLQRRAVLAAIVFPRYFTGPTATAWRHALFFLLFSVPFARCDFTCNLLSWPMSQAKINWHARGLVQVAWLRLTLKNTVKGPKRTFMHGVDTT